MDRHRRREREATIVQHLRLLWEDSDPETGLIAIDPGDRYTGVAFFARHDCGGWYCQDVVELGWVEFQDQFSELLLSNDYPKYIVYERFRLYNDKAELQTGSEFETSQAIGVIKFLHRAARYHAEIHHKAHEQGKLASCQVAGRGCADRPEPPINPVLIGQMADIKKPTTGILRHKKIKSVAKPVSREHYEGRDHVIDAELHGWKYILDDQGHGLNEDACFCAA